MSPQNFRSFSLGLKYTPKILSALIIFHNSSIMRWRHFQNFLSTLSILTVRVAFPRNFTHDRINTHCNNWRHAIINIIDFWQTQYLLQCHHWSQTVRWIPSRIWNTSLLIYCEYSLDAIAETAKCTDGRTNRWTGEQDEKDMHEYIAPQVRWADKDFFGMNLLKILMTSPNGNTLRVTGPLCWEFTGHRWIPAQRLVRQSFYVFFDLRLYKRVSKQSWGWRFETPRRLVWCHCNGCLPIQLVWWTKWDEDTACCLLSGLLESPDVFLKGTTNLVITMNIFQFMIMNNFSNGISIFVPMWLNTGNSNRY